MLSNLPPASPFSRCQIPAGCLACPEAADWSHPMLLMRGPASLMDRPLTENPWRGHQFRVQAAGWPPPEVLDAPQRSPRKIPHDPSAIGKSFFFAFDLSLSCFPKQSMWLPSTRRQPSPRAQESRGLSRDRPLAWSWTMGPWATRLTSLGLGFLNSKRTAAQICLLGGCRRQQMSRTRRSACPRISSQGVVACYSYSCQWLSHPWERPPCLPLLVHSGYVFSRRESPWHDSACLPL